VAIFIFYWTFSITDVKYTECTFYMCQLIISTAWCTAKPKPSGSVIVCGDLDRRGIHRLSDHVTIFITITCTKIAHLKMEKPGSFLLGVLGKSFKDILRGALDSEQVE